jgi:hypothetical protein
MEKICNDRISCFVLEKIDGTSVVVPWWAFRNGGIVQLKEVELQLFALRALRISFRDSRRRTYQLLLTVGAYMGRLLPLVLYHPNDWKKRTAMWHRESEIT